jgi:hypothetical protein
MAQELTQYDAARRDWNLKKRVFAYLEAHPKSKANTVCDGVGGDKSTILRILAAGVESDELLKEKGFWNARLHSVTEKGKASLSQPPDITRPAPTPEPAAIPKLTPTTVDLGIALLAAGKNAVKPAPEPLASPKVELPTKPDSATHVLSSLAVIPDSQMLIEIFRRLEKTTAEQLMTELRAEHPELFKPLEYTKPDPDATPSIPERRQVNPQASLTGYGKPSARSIWVRR